MKKILIPLAFFTSTLTPAQAQDSLILATNLGTMLGSEKYCGLTFDQSAVEAWIEKNVRADDLEFAPILQTMITGVELNNQSKAGSAKTAHCAQIKRSAKAVGFIK